MSTNDGFGIHDGSESQGFGINDNQIPEGAQRTYLEYHSSEGEPQYTSRTTTTTYSSQGGTSTSTSQSQSQGQGQQSGVRTIYRTLQSGGGTASASDYSTAGASGATTSAFSNDQVGAGNTTYSQIQNSASRGDSAAAYDTVGSGAPVYSSRNSGFGIYDDGDGDGDANANAHQSSQTQSGAFAQDPVSSNSASNNASNGTSNGTSNAASSGAIASGAAGATAGYAAGKSGSSDANTQSANTQSTSRNQPNMSSEKEDASNSSGSATQTASDDQTKRGNPPNHLKFDLEGGADEKGGAGGAGGDAPQGNDEYSNLVRYITNFKDGRRKSTISLGSANVDDSEEKKKPWWKFWASGSKSSASGETFQAPEEWMNTEMKQGLSASEIEQRRKKTGWNELTTEKENLFLKFLGYFQGPILYVMECAVLISAGLREWIDFGVIIGILMLNAIVGWYQEKQAADVVASLKGDIAMKAVCIRDGSEQEIKARELVPGDIIIVEEGQVIPADASLICDYENPQGFEDWKVLRDEDPDHTHEHDKEGNESDDEDDKHQGVSIVAADQSAITGESLAVDKYIGDTLFYTTGCKRGKGYALVTASARASFVGRTASLVQGAKDQGHFKAIMNNIGTSLLVLVVFWIIASWVGGFFRGLQIATPEDSSVNLLHYILILLIIGVPVGLPVVTTTTLAVGAAYLAKEKAIVQKLTAIESLAGVDILCSDKTGTLTANQLSIREPYCAEGVDPAWMMAVAAMASSHNTKSLDPIDKVTILTLKRYPKSRDILQEGWKTTKFTPFDPVSKRITAEVTRSDGVKCIAAKGAPKAILNLSNCSKETADAFKEKATDFARRGFRSLGVAFKEGDAEWTLLGMMPMFDPPREDTAQTIAEAQTLGLSVKMLTGDAIAIAKETCKMLALGTKVYNSERLIHGGLSGTTQHDLAERADGFAEVFPEHKYQVVEMLQQRGHLTAMTGDGVNDAPSLKKSDCGIAVEGASEAAQAAADIVFLAPGLSTIVSAIKIARQIFQRMKAYIQYRIALCLHLEIYLVTSMIIINETIRVQLVVFLALFADLATVAVAYDNAHFEPRPVEWQLPKIWIISVILGILLAAATWIVRGSLFLRSGGIVENYGDIQEILFLEISLTENWLIFVTRGGNTWPAWQLIGAIFGVDVLSTLFCLFGWLSGNSYDQNTSPPDAFTPHQGSNGHVDPVTVVVIWCYSIFVTIVIAIAYYLLNRIQALNDLGRAKRSHQDTQMENIIGHLSRLAIEHEKEKDGKPSRFYFASKSSEAENDD